MTPEQWAALVDQLRAELTYERAALAAEKAAHRRTAEELDFALESARVFRRAVARLAREATND